MKIKYILFFLLTIQTRMYCSENASDCPEYTLGKDKRNSIESLLMPNNNTANSDTTQTDSSTQTDPDNETDPDRKDTINTQENQPFSSNFSGDIVNLNNRYGDFKLTNPMLYDRQQYSIRFLQEFASVFDHYNLGKAFIGGSFCIINNSDYPIQYDLTPCFLNALYNAWQENKLKFTLTQNSGDITNMQFQNGSSAHSLFETNSASAKKLAPHKSIINSLEDFFNAFENIDFTSPLNSITGGGIVAKMQTTEAEVIAAQYKNAKSSNGQEDFYRLVSTTHKDTKRSNTRPVSTFVLVPCFLHQINHFLLTIMTEQTRSETRNSDVTSSDHSTTEAFTQKTPPDRPFVSLSTNKNQTDDVTLAHLLKRLFPTKKAAFIGATAGTGLAFVGLCAALRYCNRSNPLDSFFNNTGKILNTGTTKTANLCCLIPGAQKVGTYLYTTFDHCFPKKI